MADLNVPLMRPRKQRGGSFTVKGWVFMLLVAAFLASAALNLAYHHLLQQYQLNDLFQRSLVVALGPFTESDWNEDTYAVHPLDESEPVCDAFTPCYVRI